ncbi:myelin protein P0-like isoform X2 [Hemiscyllium ocellatum]|uniref:myelin protein P0-like isoform X2 n=1 Tax=Hemiscyllium ocellatum TaxID=170820 RepID=UPI00296734F4|nr:myelin protein P0-like isoform X2 [Hemiscyllium ocellatum]
MDLLLLLSSLIFCGICSTLAIGVYTPRSLVVKEGMELRLDCKLEYQTDIQQHNIKLEWLYSSYSDTKEVLIFFHYQNLSVIAQETVFFPRLQWVGDIGKSNGSILITDVECSDEGYFTCDMRIPRSSSSIERSRIHLKVLCEDSNRSRRLRPTMLVERVPKNIIIYTTAGVFILFVALIVGSTWKKWSIRNQRRYPRRLEDSEDTERYVTVANRNPLQIERQKEEVISKDSKTGEEETYVTMRSILQVKTPDDLPKPIVVNAPVPGKHPCPALSIDFQDNHRKF